MKEDHSHFEGEVEMPNDVLTNFEKVGEFQKKFDLVVSNNTADLPDTNMLLFRLQFLQEEVMELTRAIRTRDAVEIADALADIIYVAYGTAHYCNLPFNEIFNEVHRSNMEKEKASPDNQSKRGHGQDIVKPVFWRKPDIQAVITKHQPEVDD